MYVRGICIRVAQQSSPARESWQHSIVSRRGSSQEFSCGTALAQGHLTPGTADPEARQHNEATPSILQQAKQSRAISRAAATCHCASDPASTPASVFSDATAAVTPCSCFASACTDSLGATLSGACACARAGWAVGVAARHRNLLFSAKPNGIRLRAQKVNENECQPNHPRPLNNHPS